MNELYHHGVKGMKWGVRRYQNEDGSLTLAGKKRALKIQNRYTNISNNNKYRDKNGNLTYAGRKKVIEMQDKYSKVTGGKTLRKYSNSNTSRSNIESQKPKSKSISEMSNQEIQAKIDRIRLENTLKSLTPEHVSTGQKFVNGLKGAAISIAKDKGTKLAGDYIDKQLRDKLGLSVKDSSKILQETAQEYENRQKIDKGQKYFKEGKYADKANNSDKEHTKSDDQKKETWYGTVEGTGTSKQTNKQTTSKKKNKSYYEPIDIEWREVNSETINSGRSYINQLLLEDKKKNKR